MVTKHQAGYARNEQSKGFFRRGVRIVFPYRISQVFQVLRAVDEFLDFL